MATNDPPVLMSAYAAAPRWIMLNWLPLDGATGVQVFRTPPPSQPFPLGWISPTSITDQGCEPDTTYTYQVCAYYGSDQGVCVSSPAIRTPPASTSELTPPVIDKVNFGEESISVHWNGPTRYTYFNVLWSKVGEPDEPQVKINSTGFDGSWGTDGLAPATAYRVIVQGCEQPLPVIGHSSCSAWSPEARMSTLPAVPTVRDLMLWRGTGADQRLWWATFDGRGWSDQAIGPGNTTDRPAVASVIGLNGIGQAAAAWKGMSEDQRIFWSVFADGSWTPQQPVAGGAVGTSCGPALACMGGLFHLVWKGEDADPRVFWATSDGHAWSDQQPILGGAFGTSASPALAPFPSLGHPRQVVMAWKGKDTDERLFWATCDGRVWSDQQPIGGGTFQTSHGPAAVAYRDRTYLAWKGRGNDTRIFWASYDGTSWTDQHPARAFAAGSGPALAYNTAIDQIVMTWRGEGSDERLFWATFNGQAWSDQQPCPAGATDTGPGMAALP